MSILSWLGPPLKHTGAFALQEVLLSVAVLAKISQKSPRKLFTFIIRKKIQDQRIQNYMNFEKIFTGVTLSLQ